MQQQDKRLFRHIVMMGPPGAGKGTQASLLIEKLGLHTFSTGQLLRDEAATGSKLGKKISSIIDGGNLLPSRMLMKIVEKELEKPVYRDGYILDGVPRKIAQAKALDKIFASRAFRKYDMAIDLVVYLQVPDDYVIERIIGRSQCAKCGTMYHDKFKPTKVFGICDQCGGKEFTRRADDNYEAIMTRLKLFRLETAPIIPYYEKKGLLVCVDGTGPIDVVSEKIRKVVGY